MTSRLAISISVLSIVAVSVSASACGSAPDERAVQSHEGITLGDVYNLGAIARTIPTPAHRALYWRRALPNARIAALASELGVAVEA